MLFNAEHVGFSQDFESLIVSLELPCWAGNNKMRHQLPSENTKMFGSRRDYTLPQCLIIEHVIERGFYGVTDELRHKHAIFPQTSLKNTCSLLTDLQSNHIAQYQIWKALHEMRLLYSELL